MPEANLSLPHSPPSQAVAAPMEVRLEVRNGTARPVVYEVSAGGFLIGSVPGCDLRLPGADLPPVICLLAPSSQGARIRKLAPAQPLFVNGQTLADNLLANGNCLTIGEVEIHVTCTADEKGTASADPGDRSLPTVEKLGQPSPPADEQVQQLARQWQEVEEVRQELAGLRQQLYERYQQRRDRLAGLQEAVNNAARKVQERKREVDVEFEQLAVHQNEIESRRADSNRRAEELERLRQALAERESMLQGRLEECLAREGHLNEDRETLEKEREEYREDLVRLERARAAFEEREKHLQEQVQAFEQRSEQLRIEEQNQEEQARQLQEWHDQMSGEADQVARQRSDHEAALAALEQRLLTLDEQQKAVASMRSRLDQMREDVRRQEDRLAEQRLRQDEVEEELRRRSEEGQRIRAAIGDDRGRMDQELRGLEERAAAVMETELRLQHAQENLAAEEKRLRQESATLEAISAKHEEDARQNQERSTQLFALQEQLANERQTLRQREAAILQQEQARLALQEQLRRRSQELSERQKALAELSRQRAEEVVALEARRVEIERDRQQAESRLVQLQQEILRKTTDLERLELELRRRETILSRQIERLKEAGRTIGKARKTLAVEREQWEAQQQKGRAEILQARVELENLRGEVVKLGRCLPDLELRAQASAERLSAVREQLRGHLEELHTFARQRYEDLEALRAQAQEEAEKVRQQANALYLARDEHRLAVAGFRQQIIAWQGQIADSKRTLSHGETRLERRQVEIDEAARTLNDVSERLNQQAEQLQEQKQEVAQRREEVDRHLTDMREWYRRKLRELASQSVGSEQWAVGSNHSPQREQGVIEGSDQETTNNEQRTTNEDIDPGDQQLGDLLRSLELVDGETLTALLLEARRQHRSLRQVLLTSGHVTLYQLALIESENMDGLVLGPVRVVDRLRVTQRETVYRIFDPRRGQNGSEGKYAVLRHLAESEMQDAAHAEEYRRRFAAVAAVRHPNLAETYEVLEIAGRPAVLQEWLTGLPGTEWSELADVPSIAYRLLRQAAEGLQVAHQAGLVHGRLNAGLMTLTNEGVLKLCGFGEPAWLVPGSNLTNSGEPKPEDDLVALGHIASVWIAQLARGKGAKSKAAKPLLDIVQHLTAKTADGRYANAAALLADLDEIAAGIPEDAEAWDRLMRVVREEETDDESLRQSA